MENFDLIDALQCYCTKKGWLFVNGNSQMANIELDRSQISDDKLVLVAEFTATPSFKINSNALIKIDYAGTLMLGTKGDGSHVASMDETTLQKWNTRTKKLCQQLFCTAKEVACTNSLDITSLRIELELMRFDACIDVAVATIVFSSDPEMSQP